MSGYPMQQPQSRPGNTGHPGAPATGGYGVGSPPDPYFTQTNIQNYPSYGSVTGGGYNHNQDGIHNSNSFNRSNPQFQHPNSHMNSTYNGVHTSPRAGPGGVGPGGGVGGYDPYTRSPGVGGRGYDDEYNDPSSPPTDFDALFSGKSRPSIVVTGQAASQFPVGKASKVLGLDDPHNLVYENSGFSRTVHFDTSLPSPDDINYNSAEVYAQKRRGLGFLPSFMRSSHDDESIAQFPKKSKSKFVTKNKMNKNDRWLEWAEKTRMEAQIKKEEFVRKQEEAAKRQLPAPIKKARKESVKFVNHQYIPSDEETPLSKAMSTMPLPAAQQKQQSAMAAKMSRDKYTEEQWRKLHEYWEHPLFQKCRPIGYIVCLLVMIVAIPPLLSANWVELEIYKDVNYTYALIENETYLYYPEYNCSTANVNGTCYETLSEFSHRERHGLWFNCTTNQTSFSGIGDEACTFLDRSGPNQWQSAVIGLLLFALAFGFLASVLTTCGICALSLAKKVYYYHSAGEIFFVCGVCATAAMVAYAAVMESAKNPSPHEFGIGFYLGWGMPLCYFISAFCMTLDDMIHSLTNDCCLICRGRRKAAAHV